MNTNELIEAEDKYFINTFARQPIVLDHGKGVKVWDKDGNEYIDMFAGIAVNALGHAHPKLVNALQGQVEKLIHVSNIYYNEPAIEYAKKLLPLTEFDRLFYANSGAEANEGAIKLALKYTGKSEIITAKDSFHGRTLLTLAATGHEEYREPYLKNLPQGFIEVPYNDIEAIKEAISDETAAIMLEPIQGEGGVNVPSKKYFDEIAEICAEKDILLILDEVQCGMGRTGTIMTYFQYDILPDILCLAKGIGAGFPMGAFVANKKFAAAMEPGDHGSTYGGNPMAGQACRTVFKILEETKMLDHVQDISEYLIEKLDDLKDKYSCIKERRGLGLMIGLEFDRPVKDIVQTCLDNGLIVVMAGANVIRMLPPFITTEKDVDQAIAILDQAIEKNI